MVLDEDNQKQLILLRRKRGVIKASLTRLRNFTKEFDTAVQSIALLEFRQEELPQISKKFDVVQCEIEMISEDAEKEDQEREAFEKDYFDARAQMQEIINGQKQASTVGHNQSFGSSGGVHRSRLAPIPLPDFKGNIENWESFYDVFQALVHNDDSLSPSQKLYYLRSCLSGPALDIISSIPMTDNNYEVVLQRLKQRYDNKSLVIQTHIRALLDSPRVETATTGSLQKLYSHIGAHVAALKALGQPIEHWDAWLVTIVLRHLDKCSLHEWQLHQTDTQLPKYVAIEQFLANRCIAFEGSGAWDAQPGEVKSNELSYLKKHGSSSNSKKMALVIERDKLNSCIQCSGPHRLYHCDAFKKLHVSERLTVVRNARLCFNCFSPNHVVDKCKSKYSCFGCKKRHNSLLHLERAATPVTVNSEESATADTNEVATVSVPAQALHGHVFLATASILARDNCGLYRNCRMLLDSGSQVNFISRKLSNKLQLTTKEAMLPITGIGSSQVRARSCVEVRLKSRVTSFSLQISCYILPVIVNSLPAVATPVNGWQIPDSLSKDLADPGFAEAGSIDLLIGGGSFFELLEHERVQLETESLYLQGSKFGWIVTGEVGVSCLAVAGSIGEGLEEDWMARQSNNEHAYGRSSKGNKKAIEEEQAKQHFASTAKRDVDGRFILRLPVKSDVVSIGNSINMAKSRFLNVEQKLQRDEALRVEYVKFMKEYLDMGHMEEVANESDIPEGVCYLPHHAVVKTASLTTRVRVVFDASARGTNGRSLNDILVRGPTVQDDIFAILSRLRRHQYVIMADVEKMYRQIKIAPEDCDLQRILWRSSPTDELLSYRLLRITYGTVPASFMATQCLVTLAEEFEKEYPLASRSIKKDFYMDDLMTGSETEEGCLILQREISTILDSAKLPLRKWCSNSSYVREQIGKGSDDPLFSLDLDKDDTVKSLGLCWKPTADEFRFNIIRNKARRPVTKRILLSDLNRVFDPLGFLTPVLIIGKIFLQQLWQLKADWDSVLSSEIQEKWSTYYNGLEELKQLSIPRGVICPFSKRVEVHGFCDASQEAYGACVYIRSVDQGNAWNSHLLCAKSRVAPLKGSTIPRLELNGALCLAQLISKVAESWGIECRSCRLWTDSTIVLGWLNSQASCLKTYIANRVGQILELTDAKQWNYVSTKDNPADIISRGINARAIDTLELWWKGPYWLMTDESSWTPHICQVVEEKDLPERKNIKLALVATSTPNKLLQYYSDWNRLRKGVSWLLRFVKYLQDKNSVSRLPYNSKAELQKAEVWILKRVQCETFHNEVLALRENKELPTRSKLKCLNPYMKDGLVLVGGRLTNSSCLESRKYPIVLPANHKVTQLIFKQKHIEQLHCGPQALLAEVRRQYWPLRGRAVARSSVLKCIRCTRARPRIVEPIMAPLPRKRVQCARPFSVTGVDFAGPLIIRSGIRRVVGIKAWIAVFVCFVTRAIHLEIVEDLTSKSFIASLRRFMSRRGRCTTIYSDNGTNFVGAEKELKSYIVNAGPAMAQEGIEWRFNPPAAPHFGGLWESAVKSAKHHLSRMMGEAKLTLSELNTLLCQIEACLNSRPITPMSSEPSDAEALTPAHFLIGGAMTLPPEPDLSNENIGHLRRWKYVQLLMQTFWRRWQLEYLPQFQVRGKWVTKTAPLQIDNIVIIKDEGMPPTRWKLGRIIKVHPGSDGVIRVATVRTANGSEMKRPTVKLCVLPTEADTIAVENQDFQRGENVYAEN